MKRLQTLLVPAHLRAPGGTSGLVLPALSVAALLIAAPAAEAQLPQGVSAADAATPQEAEVLAVVDRLFDAMRARDADMLQGVFHPDARMLVAPREGEAPTPASMQPVDGFIESIGAEGPPIHEPYFDPEVRIDGHLAHVWTFYHLYQGEEFSHCGYDSFELVRTLEGWRIVFIAYTVRTEGGGG